MQLIECILYLSVVGILSFLIGEALPRSAFKSDSKPFSLYSWEKSGSVYERLHIRRWKDSLPDMSKVHKKMFPKRLPLNRTNRQHVERLIIETCVAETVHIALIIVGFGCLLIWPGRGGMTVSLLWAFGNLPYIMIQRYNRPRLKSLSRRLACGVENKENNRRNNTDETADLNLSYGRRA